MKDSNMPFPIPKLMGIVNITQDSFFDGSRYLDATAAVDHAKKHIQNGADFIDLGAESTRPGSSPVSPDIELKRLMPVLQQLVQEYPHLICSIDTRKASVAQQAISIGARLINDVSALRYDPGMAEVIAAHPQVRLILMHMQGEPDTMQQNPSYTDVVAEIGEFFTQRIEYCLKSGIERKNLLLDPGIGFGKNLSHNLSILSHLESFRSFGLPLVLGASRKRFINEIVPSEPLERLGGTLAASLWASMQQVQILRVHDVLAHRQFFEVSKAIDQYRK